MGGFLGRGELDDLSESAAGSADPAAVAAQLVAAAEQHRLADPADTGYAYLLAAELQERADDLPGALALAERALAACGEVAGPRDGDPARVHALHARLLLQLGHDREGLAELAELPPDPYEHDAAPDGGSGYDGGYETGGDAGYEGGDDQPPEAADAVLLVWSEQAYEQVDQRWPEILEPTGAESWEEYRRYCQAIIAGWPRHSSLLMVTGEAEGFAQWLEEEGADPYGAGLAGLARRYGDYLAEETEPRELPPGRDEPCWCGSVLSYARCCQLLTPPQ